MTFKENLTKIYHRVWALLGGARMTSALVLVAFGMAFCSRFIRSLVGWPGFIGALTVLCLLAVAALIVRRESLEWRGLLPLSLLIFFGWSTLTVIWSDHQWASLTGVLYQFAFMLLGIFVALTRNLIQVLRAVGDVIRFSLVASLALEIVAGLLIDMPIRFLGIEGNLSAGLPIQGIFGVRNQLGIVALLGGITFVVELATRSVTRTTAIFSFSLAALSLALTRSPVVFGTALAVVVAAGLLLALRRLPPASRKWSQWVLLALVTFSSVVAWAFRAPIIDALNAGSEFEARYGLWQLIRQFVNVRPLEGWGWVGLWRTELQPFYGINVLDGRTHNSALNAFLDVWFQAGLVGLFCFVVLVALTMGRSWALASTRRGIDYIWPALVLVALLVFSLAESVLLVDYGWLLFVTCAVAAAHRLSWRRKYRIGETLETL